MEDLSQTQIVLLCLLTSFVTSIGTGIITTSLLREAPQTVTQTINRVVERTVQTIAPQSNIGTPTKEVTTVVVKEEELVVDAISKSRGSLVRIVKTANGSRNSSNNSNNSAGQTFQSIGVVTKKDGTILADKRFVTANGSYNAVTASGLSYPVSIAKISPTTNAVFLIPIATADATSTPKIFTPEITGNSDAVQLGQTVIAMGGKDKEAVSIGRINSVDQLNGQSDDSTSTSATATSTPVISSIQIDTPLRDSAAGSILLNLNGLMVGFENYDVVNGVENMYTSISQIRRENPTFFEPSPN